MGLIHFDLKADKAVDVRDPAPGAIDEDQRILGINGAAKWALDIALVLPALIFLLPIFIGFAVIIKLDGGPVLFAQKRIGRSGKTFHMLKLRTMRVDAEAALSELIARCPDAAAEWAQYQKLRNDPRVTWVGRFLRKSSIDELPQLFNILRGDMSVVGQRPILPCQCDSYGRHMAGYERARPGLTGLWQVRGRNALSFEQRAQMGSEYINRWSLWFDIKLILLTVPAVMLSKDAY